MSADHASHAGHDAHGHHDASHSPKHYIRIWAVLCVLLAISVTGPMLEIPVITLLTAFGIAGVKAWLVMKHFMHLPAEKPVIIFILATGIVFILMFFSVASIDVMSHDGARWSNNAAKAAITRGLAAGDPAAAHGAHHESAAPGAHAPAEPAPAGH